MFQGWWGDLNFEIHPSLLFNLTFTLASILAWDFGMYFYHYKLHKIPFLSDFHKVHHSAEVLTPVTNFRVHPVEKLLTSFITGLLVGTVQGAFKYFSANELSIIEVIQFNVVMILFIFMGHHLRHSHIWLSFGSVLNWIFVSPAQHQIHHSVAVKHYGKNLGAIFAVWDWFFGTLYVPKEKEDIQYGLADEEHRDFSRLWHLLLLPFQKNAQSRGGKVLVLLFIALLLFLPVYNAIKYIL